MTRPSAWVRTSVFAASCTAFGLILGGCDDPHNDEGIIKTSPKARENITNIGKDSPEAPPSPYGSKGKILGGPKAAPAPDAAPKDAPKE